MVGGTWWASRARQVSTCERFRIAWLKSSRGSIEYVSCIQGEELSQGTLRVGFWNRPLVWPATRCLVPFNGPWENQDTILGVLFGISPEIVVLVGSFQDELGLMRTRHRWPTTVRAVAAVAASLGNFSAELGHIADGVIGPSQWEPGMTFPNIAGPASDWFLGGFQEQFGQPPDYIAAGSFATGLVLTECIRRAASLDDEQLRKTASDLDCNTFYGRFRISSNRNTDGNVVARLARRPQSSAAFVTEVERKVFPQHALDRLFAFSARSSDHQMECQLSIWLVLTLKSGSALGGRAGTPGDSTVLLPTRRFQTPNPNS